MTLYCVCRKKLLVLGGKEDLTYWAWGENNSDTHDRMMANFLYQCKSQFEDYIKGSKEIPQLRCADLLRNSCQRILCLRVLASVACYFFFVLGCALLLLD